MGRVVVLGSLNVDLVTTVASHPAPGQTVTGGEVRRWAGGKGANQAMAAARGMPGAPADRARSGAAAAAGVVMLGCVGDDEAGEAHRDKLRRAGVDVSGVRVVEGAPTGTAIVTVDAAGENTIVVVPGANAQVGAPEVQALGRLGRGDVLLAQLEIPVPVVERAIGAAADAGATVVLNTAPPTPLSPSTVAAVDVLVANEHEAALLADSAGVPRSLLVTLGSHGALWDGQPYAAHPVPAEQVLDTTGAGDAFCGALAAALATGASRHTAIQAALAAGARAVQHRGAQPDPTL